MVLDELGYSAISPTSESVKTKQNVLDSLKKRFKRIVVIADNDSAGERMAEYYFLNFNIPYVFLSDTKDVSDYSKKYGITELKKHLKKLLI